MSFANWKSYPFYQFIFFSFYDFSSFFARLFPLFVSLTYLVWLLQSQTFRPSMFLKHPHNAQSAFVAQRPWRQVKACHICWLIFYPIIIHMHPLNFGMWGPWGARWCISGGLTDIIRIIFIETIPLNSYSYSQSAQLWKQYGTLENVSTFQA